MSQDSYSELEDDMRDFFQTEIQGLGVIRDFPWANKRAYADFLAQTYYYVCHTTRLLAVCASRIGVDREKLHHRFLKHAAEERSHHLLAERDVAALGMSLADFPQRALTAAMYETQYFRAEHLSPTTIFGYILALEGLAVVYGPSVYAAVIRSHGDEAAAFVRLHSNEDPGHLESAFALLETMSAQEIASIQSNFKFTRDLYRALLLEIVANS
jgi:thiaminase